MQRTWLKFVCDVYFSMIRICCLLQLHHLLAQIQHNFLLTEMKNPLNCKHNNLI